MRHAVLFLLVPFLLSSVVGGLDAQDSESMRHFSGGGDDRAVDAIRFTDRASLDPKLERYLSGSPSFLGNWKEIIKLPNPPDNSSPRSQAELAYLKALQSTRTEKQEADIEQQIKVLGMKLGRFEMGRIQVVATSYPATKRILDAAQRDMELIVFQLKASYNRARPSHLTKDLIPSIPVPGHSAYPSGHATQAYLLAYLLMELAPDQGDQLIRDAAQIAKNREIAGVHYPSDSEAGQQLARQIVDLLLRNRAFQALLVAAKSEQK